jgi:hypothetical protein
VSLEARADEAAATALVKAMSDHMAGQKAISFSFDTDLEIITKDKQKLALANSGTATLSRPDNGRNADAYGRCGTNTAGQFLGADLLQSNLSDALMPLVTDVKDLGSGVIGGAECDHLAFRTDKVDRQIWIAEGARPYPCFCHNNQAR